MTVGMAMAPTSDAGVATITGTAAHIIIDQSLHLHISLSLSIFADPHVHARSQVYSCLLVCFVVVMLFFSRTAPAALSAGPQGPSYLTSLVYSNGTA